MLVVVGVIDLLSLASLPQPVRAGHGGLAQCPTGNEHCLARAQMFPGDDRVVGIIATLSNPGRPCAQASCGNAQGENGCGGFSAMPIWIPATRSGHGSTDVVPEIGVVRFDSPDGGLTPHVYSYCNNCDQSDGWQLHDIAYGGMKIMLWYEPSSDEWAWYLIYGGEIKHLRSARNIGMAGGSRVDVGGETTDWHYDMGVAVYKDIAVNVASSISNLNNRSWIAFVPNPGGFLGFYPPGDEGRGRYFNASIQSKVFVMSDHHYSHSTDACGDTP